jgi:hypothetical protein
MNFLIIHFCINPDLINNHELRRIFWAQTMTFYEYGKEFEMM